MFAIPALALAIVGMAARLVVGTYHPQVVEATPLVLRHGIKLSAFVLGRGLLLPALALAVRMLGSGRGTSTAILVTLTLAFVLPFVSFAFALAFLFLRGVAAATATSALATATSTSACWVAAFRT